MLYVSVQSGTISYYELLGSREVVLYWRCMPPNHQATVTFDVLAAVPGVYTAQPSRAYLYYTKERKHWAAPLSVRVNKAE